MKLTITNISPDAIYVSMLARELKPQESRSTVRSVSDIDSDGQLKKLVIDGLAAITLTADESDDVVGLGLGDLQKPVTDLWVDAVNGSDDNPGTEVAPFRTLTTAARMIPYRIVNNFTIHLKAGNYTGTAIAAHIVRMGAVLRIVGEDTTPFQPVTGPRTGVFTSSSGGTVTMSAAGWTVNDLRFKFLHVMTGSLAGTYYPIASNTADSIETPAETTTALVGQTFEIVEPAANILPANGYGLVCSVMGGNSTLLPSLRLEWLKFSGGATSDYAIRVPGNGTCIAERISAVGMSGVYYSLGGTSHRVANSAFQVPAGSEMYGVRLGSASISASVQYTVISGGTAGVYGSATGLKFTLARCILEGGSSYGLGLYEGTARVFLTYTKFRNNTRGLFAQADMTGYASQCEFTGNQFGAVFWNFNVCGNINIGFYTCTFSNNTQDGILMDGAQIRIDLGTTSGLQSRIENNGRWGINLATVRAGFNCLSFDSNLVMAGNVSGDICYAFGGTTPTAISAVRSATNKNLIDPVSMNRVWEK